MYSISTGNAQMDDLLGGGITKSKNTILVGDPGSGKTTLALQFITNPAASKEICAYVCIDKKPEKVMEMATSMKPHIQQQIKNETLKFVEISFQDWTIDAPINDLLLSIQLQLDALFHNFNIERLVIDSLLPHFLSPISNDKKQYFMRELLHITKSFNATAFCILYDPNAHHYLWLDTDLVHDQLIFTKHRTLGYTTYSLAISKNHHNNHHGSYRYDFDESKGIQVRHQLC